VTSTSTSVPVTSDRSSDAEVARFMEACTLSSTHRQTLKRCQARVICAVGINPSLPLRICTPELHFVASLPLLKPFATSCDKLGAPDRTQNRVSCRRGPALTPPGLSNHIAQFGLNPAGFMGPLDVPSAHVTRPVVTQGRLLTFNKRSCR
jgi:hypothetical protein